MCAVALTRMDLMEVTMTITDEIRPLTEKAVTTLLKKRQEEAYGKGNCRREVARWPFPGTVELWVAAESGVEDHQLGTCEDLSVQGAGLRSDIALDVGLEMGIAIHEPEVSFHGRAVVRHCTETEEGYFTVGVEFLF